MIPDALVERVARAMCEEMGYDPDGRNTFGGPGFPLWEGYAVQAREFIAFQRAWERVKK